MQNCDKSLCSSRRGVIVDWMVRTALVDPATTIVHLTTQLRADRMPGPQLTCQYCIYQMRFHVRL